MKSSFWIYQAENQAQPQQPASLSIILSHKSQQVQCVLKLGIVSAAYCSAVVVLLSFKQTSGIFSCGHYSPGSSENKNRNCILQNKDHISMSQLSIIYNQVHS